MRTAAPAHTRQSMSSAGAKFSKPASGRRSSSPSRNHTASNSPSAVAAAVATRLSASHCRAMAPRDAPSAMRTAISPPRSVTVASDALAMLAQAASSARAATTIAKTSARPSSGVIDSGRLEAGTTENARVRFSRGYSARKAAAIVVSSALAAASEAPGARRAVACSQPQVRRRISRPRGRTTS